MAEHYYVNLCRPVLLSHNSCTIRAPLDDQEVHRHLSYYNSCQFPMWTSVCALLWLFLLFPGFPAPPVSLYVLLGKNCINYRINYKVEICFFKTVVLYLVPATTVPASFRSPPPRGRPPVVSFVFFGKFRTSSLPSVFSPTKPPFVQLFAYLATSLETSPASFQLN